MRARMFRLRMNNSWLVIGMDKKRLETGDFSQIKDDEVRIVIKVEGTGLAGQIDASVASQILMIQDEISRIAKLVIFGDEASTRRLPRDAQSGLLIQFKVERGCTELLGEILDPLSTIFTAWGNKMTPEQLTEVTKTIAYIIAGGYLTSKVINSVRDLIAKYLDNKHTQQTSQQSNQHAEIIADKIIESAKSAPDNIIEAAAKNFRSAHSMKYGPRMFNEKQLDELRGRAPRSKLQDIKKTKSFIILKLNGEKRPTFYADLQEIPDGQQIRATYHQPDDSLFDRPGESYDYVVREMSLAFATNEPIKLSVVYFYNDAKEVVRATILNVAP